MPDASRAGAVSAHPPALLRRLARGLPWLLVIWMLAGAIPLPPWPIGAGVDASWYLALNYIHHLGIRFGREIAYTSGPLGYLFTPEPEFASAFPVLWLRLAMWGAIVLAAVTASRRFGAAHGAAVTFVIVSQALLDRSSADVWQAAYTAALLSFAWAGAWSPVLLAVAALAAGFSMLLKVNEGWTALGLYYLLCVPALWRHRPGRGQTALFLALPPAIVLAWFGLVERDLLAVIPFLWNSLETMRGYSEAMSVSGPLWQFGLTLLYGALIPAVAALSGGLPWLRKPEFLCFLLSAFMGFKHAMVRQDGHADLALQKLALAGLFLLACSAAQHFRRVLLLVLVFGSSFTWFYVAQEQQWLVRIAASRLTPAGIAAGIRRLFAWEDEYLKHQQFSTQARLHLQLPAEFHHRIGAGAIDGFPHCIDVIRANGWNYRPRPTIESGGAYTLRLDLMNASHLAGKHAPGFALFVWEAIDGRHPLLQDAATLHALRKWYTPALTNERALLLARRQQPLEPRLAPAGESLIPWEDQLPVPEPAPGESIYFSAEIRPSFYGHLRAFFLRAAPIYLRAWRHSGKEANYRTVRQLLHTPAQIRPLPDGLLPFAAMLQDPDAKDEDPVRAVAWLTPGPAEYSPIIRIRWFRIRWPGSPAAQPSTTISIK